MELPLGNAFLYAAHQLRAKFSNKYGSGELTATSTCFNVHDRAGKRFFITNRHCIDAAYRAEKYVGYELASLAVEHFVAPNKRVDDFPAERTVIELPSELVQEHPNPTVDLAAVPAPPSAYAALSYTVGPHLIPTVSSIESSVWAGERVFFPGFPIWHDKNGIRPVFRTGHIVSDPRNNYRREVGEPQRGDGDSQIAFEAMSFDGNSGSPVFLPQRGFPPGGDLRWSVSHRPPLLIGINAGHVNRTLTDHSGLSYMYKASCLRDMIDFD